MAATIQQAEYHNLLSGVGAPRPKRHSRSLLTRQKQSHLGAARRARAFGHLAAFLVGDDAGILHGAFLLALHTIGFILICHFFPPFEKDSDKRYAQCTAKQPGAQRENTIKKTGLCKFSGSKKQCFQSWFACLIPSALRASPLQGVSEARLEGVRWNHFSKH